MRWGFCSCDWVDLLRVIDVLGMGYICLSLSLIVHQAIIVWFVLLSDLIALVGSCLRGFLDCL